MSDNNSHGANKFLSIRPSPIVVIGSLFLIGINVVVAAVFAMTKIQRNHIYLTHLYDGIAAYARDHNDTLPDMSSMKMLEHSLYPKYVRSRLSFYDPYTYKYYRANAALSHKPLTPLRESLCPPVLLSSHGGHIYASGRWTIPDTCHD